MTGKTMLDVLEKRLPDGVSLCTFKELRSKYIVTLAHDGNLATVDLPKSCTPGAENEVADFSVCTAMAKIAIDRGDLEAAKEWLDKGRCSE